MAAKKIEKALLVFMLDPSLRERIAELDPNAYRQMKDALLDEGTLNQEAVLGAARRHDGVDHISGEEADRCRRHASDRYEINSNEHIQIERNAPVRACANLNDDGPGALVQAWLWVPLE